MSTNRKFAKYVSQNIFGMLGMSCYILADTFFISVAEGTNGIAALNLVLPIYNIIYAIGAMLAIGSATRYSIEKIKEAHAADAYFSNAVFVGCMAGAIFFVLGMLVPDEIIRLMGGDETLVLVGTDYTRIFMLFAPFFILNYIFGAFVRNDGAPTLAMIATLTSSFSNIILDYVFMFPLGMGMAGAALATGMSPVIGMIICSIHFFSKKNTIKFLLKRPSLKRTIRVCHLGVSSFIGEISSGVITVVFNYLILGLVGTVGVAAYGIIANYSLVAISIFNGIAQGAQPIISEAYGKGDKKTTKIIRSMGIKTAICTALMLMLVMMFFGEEAVKIFNHDNSTTLMNYAVMGIQIYFAGFLFAGYNIVSIGYLSATEQATPAFIASFARGLCLIIVVAIVFAKVFGLLGVWLAFATTECVTAVFLFVHNKKGRTVG